MPLMVIEAMKMETTVISKVNGIVDKIYVKDGEEVNEDTLLASFIIDTDEQPEEVHPELPKMDLASLEEDEFKTVEVAEKEIMKFGGVDGKRAYYSARSICISR